MVPNRKHPERIAEVTFVARAKQEIVYYWNEHRHGMTEPLKGYKGNIDMQKIDSILVSRVNDDWRGIFMVDWVSLVTPIPYIFEVQYTAASQQLRLRSYLLTGESKASFKTRRPSGVFPEKEWADGASGFYEREEAPDEPYVNGMYFDEMGASR